MDIATFFLLFTAVVNFAFFVFILAKSENKGVKYFYASLTFGIFVWAITMLLFRASQSQNFILFWGRLTYVSAVLVSFSFFMFSAYFPENKRTVSKYVVYLFLLLFLSFGLASFFGHYIIISGSKIDSISYLNINLLGNLFYGSYVAICFIFGFVALIKKYKIVSSIYRLQLKYVLIGSSISIIISFVISFLLTIIGSYKYSWLGPTSTLILASFIFYAITRYRLMDIKVVYSNFFVYILLIVFSESVFYFSLWVGTKFFGTAWSKSALAVGFFIALLFSMIFIRLIKFSGNWSDQLFYHGLNPKHVIDKMIISAARILDLGKLSNYLIQEIKKIIDADRVAIVLFPPDSDIAKKIENIREATREEESQSAQISDRVLGEIGNVEQSAFGELGHTSEYSKAVSSGEGYVYKQEVKNASSLIETENNKELIQACSPNALKIFNQADFPLLDCVKHQLIFNFLRLNKIETSIEDLSAGRSGGRHSAELAKIFLATGISLAVPLISREQIIGAIILSEKYGKGAYSEEDIDFLRLVGAQIASSFMNAYLNEQVEVLNQNLEERVKAQTEDIIEKNKHLEKLLAMRSEFLNVASHQLRTPISVIKGMMSMFHEGSVRPQDMQLFVEGTFVKSLKLADIIDDVLKANEIESEGEYTIALSPTTVEPVLEAVIKEKSFEAKDKKINLELILPKEKLPKVLSENEALERAVKTLVSNALIYTKEGGVKVSAVQEGDSVIIRVSDTGIGISKEDVPKLFHKFARAKNATHAYTDGSGLGLYIAKKIINAHKDAEIYVEKSVLGEGTTFAIKLKAEG